MSDFASNTLNSYLAIAPEIGLLVLVIILFGYERFAGKERRRNLGLITAWGMFFVLIGTLIIMVWALGNEVSGFRAGSGVLLDAAAPLVWGGTIRFDLLAFVFRLVFITAALITALISVDTERLVRSEYFGLIAIITIGMNMMGAASELILLYVALETVSICMYVLAGFVIDTNRSVEAGMKYFVYGSFASGLMLFGFSWLYGLMGTINAVYGVGAGVIPNIDLTSTNIYRIGEVLSAAGVNGTLPEELELAFLVSAVLVIVGFGFKVSLVPFHFWTPDVYEGAPSAVTAFLSTASKAAGFAVFIRVFSAGTFGLADAQAGNLWWALLAAMAIVTMIIGNLLAIFQSNIKRMLAYSSVAQAGYIMIGLVIFTVDGAGAAIYYLVLYMFTNIAAFAVIILISNVTHADEMTDLYGLNRRSPYMALVMMLALLSLGGIPPTAGFFGKFFLFRAAVEAGFWWLAVIGILNAFIALYYYLNVIKYMYLYEADEEKNVPIPVSRAASVALAVTALGILILGLFPNAVFELSQQAALQFFPFN